MEIREALEKEYDSAEAPAPAVEASPVQDVPEPAEPSQDRPRDEAGRFAKKVTDQSPSEGSNETAVSPEQAPPSIEAPRSWSAERKALFAQLPPDAQAYIAQRESEAHTKITELGNEKGRIAKEYGELGQLIERERDSWASLGFTPAAAMGQMIAAQRQLDANPDLGILKFCHDYRGQINPLRIVTGICQSFGIHPSQIAQASQPVDPQIAALYQQMNFLQEQLQSRDAMSEQAQLSQAEQLVQNFRNETDASGKRLRPHFETVEQELEPHLIAVMQQKPGISQRDALAEAYDRAVYANPQTRELAFKERQAQQEAERAQALKQKASAGSSLTGAPGASLVSNPPKDIRGLLEAGLNGQL